MTNFTESVVEDAALAWLGTWAMWSCMARTSPSANLPAAERTDPNFRDVIYGEQEQ